MKVPAVCSLSALRAAAVLAFVLTPLLAGCGDDAEPARAPAAEALPPVSPELGEPDPGVQSFGGQVFDAVTGQPIADAVVTSTPSSEVLRTNGRGEYLIFQGVVEGSYEVRAEKEGYAPGWAAIYVAQDRFQFADMLMLPEDVASVLQVTPGAVFFPTTQRSATLFVENPSTEPLTWELLEGVPWLEVTESSRQIAQGRPELIELRVKPELLGAGGTGVLKLRDSAERLLYIPVTADPVAEAGVALTYEGESLLSGRFNAPVDLAFRVTTGADKAPVSGERVRCEVRDMAEGEEGLVVALSLGSLSDTEGLARCSFRPEEVEGAEAGTLRLQVQARLEVFDAVRSTPVQVEIQP